MSDTSSLHLWQTAGGPPWAIAESEAEARRLIAIEYGDYSKMEIKQVPDDEKFTMMYEDLPSGLESDCECEPDVKVQFGCDCGDSNSATYSAREWCDLGDKYRERVFGEFQG